jgi:hypothetical protein
MAAHFQAALEHLKTFWKEFPDVMLEFDEV